MNAFIFGFIVVVVLTPIVTIAVYYWMFRHSPLCLWRDRVLEHLEDLRGSLQTLGEIRELEDEGVELRDQLFGRYISTIPTSALDDFPGIGPGTVALLHRAGLPSLAHLVGFDYETIPGFGSAKAGAIQWAVQQVLDNARARFIAGGCPEGHEYLRVWANMVASQAAENETKSRNNVAVEKAIAALKPFLRLADDVTFWNHLLHRGQIPGLTDEVMDRSLPGIVIEPTPILRPQVVTPVAPTVQITAKLVTTPIAAKPVSQPSVSPPLQHASPQSATTVEHPLLAKLKAYCGFALVVAKADGKIAKSERKEVRELLAYTFGHDATLVRFIDPVMEQIEKNIPDEDDALAAIMKVTSPHERRMLFTVAEKIADAAGERGAREVDALRRIASALGVTLAGRASDGGHSGAAGPIANPLPGSSPSLARPANSVAILEIDPTTKLSVDLIRRRYLMLTERADSAKAAALGPEFAAMAEAKRADIRKAALELIAPFGEPLDPPAAPPKPSDIRHNPDLDDVFGG